MKLLKTLILTTATTLMAQAITPLEIVQKSDNIRNPNDSFYQKGLITEFQNAQKVDSMLISIYSKKAVDGQFKTLVKILKPKKDKEKLILRNANTMWMYDPNSKAIAQMSPQQRLMGQSSSADVMSANFALDYTLKLEGTQSIKGGDKKMVECYKIGMIAISSEVSYPTVEYWVAKDTFYPIHAKFYSANGELLKKTLIDLPCFFGFFGCKNYSFILPILAPRLRPLFQRFLNNKFEVGEGELVTEIYVPVV